MHSGSSTATLFETETSRACPQKTFVLFGMIRGGTTSVALIARELGLYLGEEYEDNLEDRCFFRGSEHALDAIKSRNETHEIWGVKHPGAAYHLDTWCAEMRNVRLVCVTRDLTAQMLGVRKYQPRLDLQQLVQHHTLSQHRNALVIERLRLPTLMLSYEKVLMNPEVAITELADFLCIPATPRTISKVKSRIVPGRYQRVGTVN